MDYSRARNGSDCGFVDHSLATCLLHARTLVVTYCNTTRTQKKQCGRGLWHLVNAQEETNFSVTKRLLPIMADTRCDFTCNFKIVFICWDLLTSILDSLTCRGYRCCVILTYLPIIMKFVWLSNSYFCAVAKYLMRWPCDPCLLRFICGNCRYMAIRGCNITCKCEDGSYGAFCVWTFPHTNVQEQVEHVTLTSHFLTSNLLRELRVT